MIRQFFGALAAGARQSLLAAGYAQFAQQLAGMVDVAPQAVALQIQQTVPAMSEHDFAMWMGTLGDLSRQAAERAQDVRGDYIGYFMGMGPSPEEAGGSHAVAALLPGLQVLAQLSLAARAPAGAPHPAAAGPEDEGWDEDAEWEDEEWRVQAPGARPAFGGFPPAPGVPRGVPVGAAPVPAPAQSGGELPPDRVMALLQDVYAAEKAAGRIAPEREALLESVLGEMGQYIQPGRDQPGGLAQDRAGLGGLMERLSGLVLAGRHDTPVAPAGSRAARVHALLQEAGAVVTGTVRTFGGASEEVAALFGRCVAARGEVKAEMDDEQVYALEATTVRLVARDIRHLRLASHVTLARPAWPVPRPRQDANLVFYAGGAPVRSLLQEICARHKLVLAADPAGEVAADARFAQLYGAGAAVFDLTGYRHDRREMSAANVAVAAVCHELGIALALGRPVVVVARRGQEMPFDVDVEPLLLDGDGRDGERLADALDRALYLPQRGGADTSVAETLAQLREICDGRASARALYHECFGDGGPEPAAHRVRALLPTVLQCLGPETPLVIHPSWPGAYPDPERRRCFHVTAFGPPWAEATMQSVRAGCARAGVEYVRGDQVVRPDIVRAIWDDLCTATHVVVDLTDANANAALELGMAQTLGRRVLLLTQHDPRDYWPGVARLRMHRYTPGPKAVRVIGPALHGFFG